MTAATHAATPSAAASAADVADDEKEPLRSSLRRRARIRSDREPPPPPFAARTVSPIEGRASPTLDDRRRVSETDQLPLTNVRAEERLRASTLCRSSGASRAVCISFGARRMGRDPRAKASFVSETNPPSSDSRVFVAGNKASTSCVSSKRKPSSRDPSRVPSRVRVGATEREVSCSASRRRASNGEASRFVFFFSIASPSPRRPYATCCAMSTTVVLVYTSAVYICVGRLGLTAHPMRLSASPVSHVATNANETPSDEPFRKLARICGSSATPHANTDAAPSVNDAASRPEHTQSPNQRCVQRHAANPQSAGQSVGRPIAFGAASRDRASAGVVSELYLRRSTARRASSWRPRCLRVSRASGSSPGPRLAESRRRAAAPETWRRRECAAGLGSGLERTRIPKSARRLGAAATFRAKNGFSQKYARLSLSR